MSLTAPFAHTSEIQKGAAKLTYIPAAEVVERLNAVLGYGNWSYEVIEAFHLPPEDPTYVVAKGRLSALGATYEQYGGVTPNRYGQNAAEHLKGRIIDLGDDYKGAASDALKKAAQMIGVGLYLALKRGPTPFKSSGSEASGAPTGSGGGASKGDESSGAAPTTSPAETSARDGEPPSVAGGAASPGGGDPSPSPSAATEPQPVAPATGSSRIGSHEQRRLSEAREALG